MIVGPLVLESSDLTIGSNDIAANAALAFGRSSASLLGASNLTATGSITLSTATASLLATGRMTATGATVFAANRTINASGALASAGSISWTSFAGLAATVSEIFATGNAAFGASADISYVFTPPIQAMTASGETRFIGHASLGSTSVIRVDNPGIRHGSPRSGITSNSPVRKTIITH